MKTGTKGSAQGNYGLMDLVAGLHWLRENLAAFGGDPERVAVLGHGTGAALANFLAVSPMAKGNQIFLYVDMRTLTLQDKLLKLGRVWAVYISSSRLVALQL